LPECLFATGNAARDQAQRPISDECPYPNNVSNAASDLTHAWVPTIPPQTPTSIHTEENSNYPRRGEHPGRNSETTKSDEQCEKEEQPEGTCRDGIIATSAKDRCERAVRSRLAELEYMGVLEDSGWNAFIEWCSKYSISAVDSGHLESLTFQIHDIDVWDHLEEAFGLERSSLDEVMGNYDWLFLVSAEANDHLIYGLDMDYLNLYICGTSWKIAHETAATYWDRKKRLQPLILATDHNRAKYLQGWRPPPKEGSIDGVPCAREYV